MSAEFDVVATRKRFPALGHNKQVYFDNAGGSQILGDVVTSICYYLKNNNVQLGASYAVGEISNAKYTAGYAAGAKYINADPDEIVLGGSTTQLFRNLSQTLQFLPGDELILSRIDHEANIASWVNVAARHDLRVKWWTPKNRENPKLVPDDLQELLSERTRLVACTHASNILGTIHDIKAIADAVHTVPGAMLCVDAVAYAPHRPIDVRALGVDFYCFSWYKVYGPHISMLYASRAAQERMRSLAHYFNPSASLEGKIALAASNYELTAALPALVAYFGSSPSQTAQTWAAIRAHEQRLQGILLAYLNSRPDITVFGERSDDPAGRVPTVSFVVAGRNSRDVVQAIERVSDFGIRWGAFYANRLVEDFLGLGVEGVVRVSMVHYNTVDEVTRFVKTFDDAVPPL